MTRESDRFEAKAWQIASFYSAVLASETRDLSRAIAAALRQAADEALERAAQAFAEAPTTQHSGAAVASILRYLTRDSAPSPVAAPAGPGMAECERCHGLPPWHEGPCRAPPSEPVAPAPDLRALLRGCRPLVAKAHIEADEGAEEGWFDFLRRIDAALAGGGEGT